MGNSSCCNHPNDNIEEADLAHKIESFSPKKGNLKHK